MSYPPECAGRSPLLSNFVEGHIILLKSQSSGQHLRIYDHHVEGKGGVGTCAQFIVHVHGQGVVSLHSVHNRGECIAIRDGTTTVGHGGIFCRFRILEIEGSYVGFECVESPGQRIGILPNGDLKPPTNTGTGLHGRFVPSVLSQAYQVAIGSSLLHSKFVEGNVILLKSESSGQHLRIYDHHVEGKGGVGTCAQFIVHVLGPSMVSLQSIHDRSEYLAIRGGRTTVGKGGKLCHFYVRDIEERFVALESVKFPGQRIGILPNGDLKPATETGTGLHGRYVPNILSQIYPVASAAGCSPLLSMFVDGKVIVLKSQSSGRHLRIYDHRVEGVGDVASCAQFIVHVIGQGVVSLQNIDNRSEFLAIKKGNTVPGHGGKKCHFYVREIEGSYIGLESVKFPGQRIGILPNGDLKPPTNTGTGLHGRFVPSLVS